MILHGSLSFEMAFDRLLLNVHRCSVTKQWMSQLSRETLAASSQHLASLRLITKRIPNLCTEPLTSGSSCLSKMVRCVSICI